MTPSLASGARGGAEAGGRARWPVWVALAAITLGGLALRMMALGRHGLWIDEGFSALMLQPADLPLWALDTHPPLYYGLLWLWSRVAMSDVWLRALSVLLGAAVIPVVYALGAALLDRAAGLWAAAIVAASWMHAQHSREARMYPLLVLCTALALLGLLRGARDGRRAGWGLYTGAGALLMWSYAAGPLYAATIAALAWAMVARDEWGRIRRPWLWSTALIGLAFAPWLPAHLSRSREVSEAFWIRMTSFEPPIFTTISDLLLLPLPAPAAILHNHLGVDPGRLLGRWVWMAIVLGALAIVLARHRPAARPAVRLLVLAYVLPIALFAAVSAAVRPILMPRVLLPTVIPLALLLGAVVSTAPRRRPGASLVAGLVVVVVTLGGFYGLRNDVGHHEDWRDFSRELQARVRPGDVILLVGGHRSAAVPARRHLDLPGRVTKFLLRRYDPTGRLSGVPQLSLADLAGDCRRELDPCLAAGLGRLRPGTPIWLVRFGSGRRPESEPWVEARLDRAERWESPGLVLERAALRP